MKKVVCEVVCVASDESDYFMCEFDGYSVDGCDVHKLK
jgi:hypothetical protein